MAAFPAASFAGACDKTVSFGLIDARTDGCLDNTADANTWTTSDLVKINGVPITPIAGTKLTLTNPTTDAPGGKIAVTTAITVAGFTLKQVAISQNLPAGNNGEEKDLIAIAPESTQKFLGLDIGGSVAWKIGKAADGTGYSKFGVVVNLPSILKNGPNEDAGGITATVGFRVDPTGVKTDAVKLEVASAFIGQVELKSLCLSYTSAGATTATPCTPPAFGASQLLTCQEGTDVDRWDGAAVVVLPTASRPQLGVFAGLRNGGLSYAGAQATGLGNSVPLASGVYLDKFGLGVCVQPPPFKFKGAAGIRFGPVVADKSAAYLDASVEYIDSRPWVIEAKGSLSLFDQQIASGFLRYQSSGTIDFGFNSNLSFGGGLLTVDASVEGWYQAENQRFDVFGKGKVCAIKIVCTGGEVAISSVGVAGCANLLTLGYPKPYWFGIRWKKVEIRAGAGYRWDDKKVNVMGTSCDVSGYRAEQAAVIAAASGPKTIKVAAAPEVVLRFQGEGGPPKLILTSPKGEVIKAEGEGKFVEGKYFFVENKEDNSTEVTIAEPQAGEWKVEVAPGSPTIIGESEAKGEPDASAAGNVTGEGESRTLEYVYEHQPGQEIQFVERGQDYEQVLGMAEGGACEHLTEPPTPKGDMPAKPEETCGKIEFKPAFGPGGERKIIGVVMNHGEPTSEIPVATYEAPAPVELKAPENVKLTRDGDLVGVSWNAVEGADSYVIDYQLGDGEHSDVVATATQDTLILPEPVAQGDTVKVTVRAIRKDGVAGAAGDGSLDAVPDQPEQPVVPPSTT